MLHTLVLKLRDCDIIKINRDEQTLSKILFNNNFINYLILVGRIFLSKSTTSLKISLFSM